MELRGPGLAKTRGEHLVSRRVSTWLRASDARFRALFEAADAVSEGSVRHEPAGAVWYGTTSLALAWPATLDPGAREAVAAIAARDPHIRLRAVRMAYREAALRAPGSLGRAVCEIRVAAREDGLRIDVDVQAPLTLPSHLGVLGKGPS
jgi:hypothetical protein